MSNHHILRAGDKAHHLRLGRGGTVQHVSHRRGGMVLLRHADGSEQSYPVRELRVRDPKTDDLTMRCRVEESS